MSQKFLSPATFCPIWDKKLLETFYPNKNSLMQIFVLGQKLILTIRTNYSSILQS